MPAAPSEVQTPPNQNPYIVVRPPPESERATTPVLRPAPPAPFQLTGPFAGGSVQRSNETQPASQSGAPPPQPPAQGGAPRPPPPPPPPPAQGAQPKRDNAQPGGPETDQPEIFGNKAPPSAKPKPKPKADEHTDTREDVLAAEIAASQRRRAAGKSVDETLAELRAKRPAEVKPKSNKMIGEDHAKTREELRLQADQTDPTNTEVGGARDLAKSGIVLSEALTNQNKSIAQKVKSKRNAHGSDTEGSDSSSFSD
jgi:hypothetical protein